VSLDVHPAASDRPDQRSEALGGLDGTMERTPDGRARPGRRRGSLLLCHGVPIDVLNKTIKKQNIFFLSTGVNNNIPEWPDSIIL
jgi:hypothetical protein